MAQQTNKAIVSQGLKQSTTIQLPGDVYDSLVEYSRETNTPKVQVIITALRRFLRLPKAA